ncbi:hypothetical protein [Qipengyuania nanhaisediminis]|uniref:Uncharacterized protein n=1 Tax=Qipengyuania nanhaisediminis TaxID=604088 RepID=A0A1I5Q9H6_9SPHN|nr:hypothetical protein [Qipengyuania nanhaisediminis]SFP42895.1 hypothetical protein SAMN04488060_2826 [Qipengyuania nanhaisediminis]
MSGGGWVWAALMGALAIAYLTGMRRDGMTGSEMVKIAAIWVGIILGAYILVSWLTGMD